MPVDRTPDTPQGALTAEELELLHAYWRAANYLSVGQIYLLDNPLLREPLALEQRSGMLGLSGSADMAEILERTRGGDERAELALGVYVHRLRGSIAAMAAALGGLDALVFTGGVGEHSLQIRAAAAAGSPSSAWQSMATATRRLTAMARSQRWEPAYARSCSRRARI